MDIKKVLPLYDRVLVRRITADTTSAGGIVIPDSAQEKPQKGEVLAVGSGVVKDNGNVVPLVVKENDTVLFAKWSGTEITVAGEELLIMKESDILAIVK